MRAAAESRWSADWKHYPQINKRHLFRWFEVIERFGSILVIDSAHLRHGECGKVGIERERVSSKSHDMME